MKNCALILLINLIAFSASAQTFPGPNQFSGQDMNYIVNYRVNVKSVTSKEGVLTLPVNKVTQTVQYFDGLGRPIQSVVTQGSPSKKDIVNPVVYDQYNRISREYLPFVPNEVNGWYKGNIVDPVSGDYTGTALQFYNNPLDKVADDLKPYAEKIFEPSPLNKVIKQGAHGIEWQPTLFDGTIDYADYFQSWNYSDFLSANVAGGGSVSVKIEANMLTVRFNAGFNSSTLKTGSIKTISSAPALPDMELGTISEGKYRVSIKDGSLYIEAIGMPAAIGSFGATFTVLLRDHAQKIKYEFNAANEVIDFTSFNGSASANWNYSDFLTSAVGGGGGVSLSIDKGIVTVTMSAGFSSVTLKTGDIKPIPGSTPVPDTDLGLIAMGNYLLSIRNNHLHIEAVGSAIPVTGFGMSSYGSTVTYSSTIMSLGYFPANSLFVERIIDEHNNEVKQYTDKQGRLILKRVAVLSGYADTYYLFDDFGNLIIVFPPEASARLNAEYFANGADRQGFLNRWAFQYRYDARRRMIEKAVPGADPVYLVYDNRNRLVLTQDGNQRKLSAKEWSFTKYDAQNRPVLMGTISSNNDRSSMQATVNQYYSSLASGAAWYETYIGPASNNVHGYDNRSFPQVPAETQYLGVTYYDVYDTFIAPPASPGNEGYSPFTQNLPGELTANQNAVIGQITGTKVKNLSTGAWMRTVNYYDEKYRVIQTVADHQKGKVRINSVYDFVGKLLFAQRKYTVNGVATTIKESLSYDHAGRLLLTRHSVNGGEDVIIAANDYNELGQLVSKGLHSTTYPPIDQEIGQPGVVHDAIIERSAYNSSENTLIATKRVRLRTGYRFTPNPGDKVKARIGFTQQEAAEKALTSGLFKQMIDYRYNIRGWLTRINNADVSTIADGNSTYDYFGMQLAYNDASSGLTTTPAYNGNISAIKWSKGAGGPVASHAYTFAYDPMNRLRDAYHFDYNTSNATWQSNNNGYGESQTYDLNGNIKTLVRKGYMGSNLDNLGYDYTGNHLNYVSDAGDANAGFVNLNTGTDDYAYDANGNLYKDKNKGIVNNGDIRYNHLNLPKEVIKGAESIKYIYDATGRKLAQEVYTNNGATLVKRTDYIGELVFEGTPGTLQFIQHSEGRVLKNGSAWEYQYHMKDHLGNIRVSFTTKPQAAANYTANMEVNQYGSGETEFDNYNSYVNNAMDHTDAGVVYERIHELNGGYHGRVGMTRSFVVMPGDQISASVYAKYSDLTVNANNNPFLGDLAYAFNVSSGSVGEQLKLYNGLSSFAALVPLGDHPEDDDTAPKAFVTILLFDNNYNLVDATWDQVSTTGASSHDLLSASIKAQEPGFAYFFLSNEHPYDVRVFFDDLTLTHTPSPIISASDYYPFGLTFNSYQRENSTAQNYLFNSGSELERGLDLGWYNTIFRNYDPAIGRFIQIDPLTDFFSGITPYSFAFDDPISYNDPDGLAPMWFLKLRANLKQAWYNATGRGNQHAVIHGRNKGKWVEIGAKTAGQRPTPNPRIEQIARTYAKEETPEPVTPTPDPEPEPTPTLPEQTPEPTPDPTPVFRDKRIPPGNKINYSERIQFDIKTDRFSDDKVVKSQLGDLVKLLMNNTGVSVYIAGNSLAPDGITGNGPDALNQPTSLNGTRTTLGALMSARARAVYNFLVGQGVNPKQLIYGTGNVMSGKAGLSVSFEIRNK